MNLGAGLREEISSIVGEMIRVGGQNDAEKRGDDGSGGVFQFFRNRVTRSICNVSPYKFFFDDPSARDEGSYMECCLDEGRTIRLVSMIPDHEIGASAGSSICQLGLQTTELIDGKNTVHAATMFLVSTEEDEPIILYDVLYVSRAREYLVFYSCYDDKTGELKGERPFFTTIRRSHDSECSTVIPGITPRSLTDVARRSGRDTLLPLGRSDYELGRRHIYNLSTHGKVTSQREIAWDMVVDEMVQSQFHRRPSRFSSIKMVRRLLGSRFSAWRERM